MHVRAELHPDAVWELRHTCTPAEAADFFCELDRVCSDPIRHSELFHDGTVSRYVLRRFSFGTAVEKIAVFHYDGNVVRVLRCRPAKPKRLRKPREPGAPGGP
jgi:hypothetical protein